jgi:hypothetical protein
MTLIFDPSRKLIYDLDTLPYVTCGAVKVLLLPDPGLDDPWEGFFAAWERHTSKELDEQLSSIARSTSGRRTA